MLNKVTQLLETPTRVGQSASRKKMIEEKVKCLVCGIELMRISRHLKRIHSLTVNEYKDLNPGAEVTSKHLRDKISVGVKKSLEDPIIRSKRIEQLLSVMTNHPYKCGWITVLGKNIYYRSSYELEGLLFLDSRKDEVLNLEVESLDLSYTSIDSSTRTTVPDWLMTLKNGLRYLIEIKPTDLLKELSTDLKIQAAGNWSGTNNCKYCIWDTSIIFFLSSTTMSLEETLEATVTHQNGGRYSLNSSVMERVGKKLPNRLILQENIKNDNVVVPNYCLCGCGDVTARHRKYKRGHNRRNCPLKEETKLKIGKSLEGRVCKEETRKKLSQKHTGKTLSPEHCKKISEALSGRIRSREAVDKMITTNLEQYASGERVIWNKNKHYRQRKNRLLSNSIIGS